MDHVWNDLKNWEEIWKEELQREIDGENHEHKEKNIEILKGQLTSIRKALKEISKWV